MSPPQIPRRIRNIALPPFDPLNRRAAELRAEGHDVISLGQAVPYFAPPAVALEAAREAVGTAMINSYVTDQGLPSLREALGEQLTNVIGTTVTRHELVITAGGNHAFALTLTTLISAGDEVILPAPYFTNHQMMVAAHGAVPIEAPIADRATFRLRWDDIAPHLTPKTRAVVLCNPSNPTGAPVDPHEGGRIVRELAARGIYVISDETYMRFVYDGTHWSAASVPDWRDNVIIVGTFSKMFGMMGWRVGFVLASADVCEHAVKVQDAMIICAPVISQVTADAAVRKAWAYPLSFHDEFRRRRETLAHGLAGIPGVTWTPTAAGLFAFARIAGCSDSNQLARDLLEQVHVVTIAGAVFGSCGEGCLRLSYGYATEPELVEATARLGQFLRRGSGALM